MKLLKGPTLVAILKLIKLNGTLFSDYLQTLIRLFIDFDAKAIKQIRLLYWLSALRFLQLACFYLFPFGDQTKILFFDLSHFYHFPHFLKPVVPLFYFVTNRCLTFTYCNPNCLPTSYLVYQFYVLKKSDYLLKSKNRRKQFKQLSLFIQRYIILFQVLTFTAVCLIIFAQTAFFWKVFTKNEPVLDNLPLPLQCPLFLVMQAFLLVDYTCWLAFVHLSLLNSSVYAAAMLAIFTRLNQINALLLKSQTLSRRRFHRFAHFHTATLIDIVNLNKALQQVILLVMTVYPPICAFFVMALLLSHVPSHLAPFILLFIVDFTLPILGFHFAASFFVIKLHSHSGRLTHLYVKTAFPLKMEQLKVSGYIAKFQTTKKYGAMYGTIGLLSAQSFAKNLILYCRLNIFSFKLLSLGK